MQFGSELKEWALNPVNNYIQKAIISARPPYQGGHSHSHDGSKSIYLRVSEHSRRENRGSRNSTLNIVHKSQKEATNDKWTLINNRLFNKITNDKWIFNLKTISRKFYWFHYNELLIYI